MNDEDEIIQMAYQNGIKQGRLEMKMIVIDLIKLPIDRGYIPKRLLSLIEDAE